MTFQSTINMQDSSTKTSVLIVDDLEANRTLMHRRLEKFGYDVFSVDGGPAALAMLEKSTTDIVLLDYMMPNMNGLEVLDRLRTNPATRDMPIIMVTARAEAEAVVESLDRGADDYVIKPIDFDILRAQMETHLEKRRAASNMAIANAVLDQRVTLRSMALADMDSELQEEIKKRQVLEHKFSAQEEKQLQVLKLNPDIIQQLYEVENLLGEMFAATTSGHICNSAKILQTKCKVTNIINILNCCTGK